MNRNDWTTRKPSFKKECVIIAASKMGEEWEYQAFQIQKVYFDGKWYFGLLTGYGDEFGNLKDFHADKYMVLPILKND